VPRNNGSATVVANQLLRRQSLAWRVLPDKTRQAADTQVHRNYAGRLTWQATPRNKFSFSYEKDRRITPLRRIASNVSPEATTYTPFYPNAISTITWRVPVNSKLLLDTGFMSYVQDWDERRQINPKVGFDAISVTEASTGQIYRASTVYGHNFDNPLTLRSSAAYVTGSHSYKGGFSMRWRGNGPTCNDIDVNGSMNYTFRNGAPSQITLLQLQFSRPTTSTRILGIFAQGLVDDEPDDDQLRHRGMTTSHASVPAQHLAAGEFVPERNFAAVDNLPRWQGTSARASACRAACSATAGRSSRDDRRLHLGRSLASNANPVNTSVNSATRSWTDLNGTTLRIATSTIRR
jgi:hypothetical protein